MAGTVNTAVWPGVYRPTPGKFGEMPCLMFVHIGTGGYAIANTATTAVNIGVPDCRALIRKISISGPIAGASASALTMQVFKRTTSLASPADVAITAATSIKSDIITGAGTFNVSVSATVANACVVGSAPNNSTLGDLVRVDIVAAGTVTTQPDLVVIVEYSIIT